MLLENIIPQLPTSIPETLIFIIAGLGIILITYGVFVEPEHRHDLIMFIGAACLFVYALYAKHLVFMLAMTGFGLAHLVEFIEILVGLHKHGPEDLKKYKKMWRLKNPKF